MESPSANPFGQTPDMATTSWRPAMSRPSPSPCRRSSSSDSSKRSANLWTTASSKALDAHKAAVLSGPKQPSSTEPVGQSPNMTTASSQTVDEDVPTVSSAPTQPASTEPEEQTPNMAIASSEMVAKHTELMATILADLMQPASTEPMEQTPDMTAASSRLLKSSDQPASSGLPAPSGPPVSFGPPASFETAIPPSTFSSRGFGSSKHRGSTLSRPMQLPPKPVRRAPTAFEALGMTDTGRFRALLNPCAVACRWSEFRYDVLETTRPDRYSRVEKTKIMSMVNPYIRMLKGTQDTVGQYRLNRVCDPYADKTEWLLTDHYLRFIFTVLKDKLKDHYYGPWTLDEYIARVRYVVYFLFELLGYLRALWLEVRGRPSGPPNSENTTDGNTTTAESTQSHGTDHYETAGKGKGPDVATIWNEMTGYERTEHDGTGKSWHASGKDTRVNDCESNGGTSDKQADDNTHGNSGPLSYCEVEKVLPSAIFSSYDGLKVNLLAPRCGQLKREQDVRGETSRRPNEAQDPDAQRQEQRVAHARQRAAQMDTRGASDRTHGSEEVKQVDLDDMTLSNFEKMEGIGATLLGHERDGALWDRMLGCVMSKPELMRTLMPMRTWLESKFPEEESQASGN